MFGEIGNGEKMSPVLPENLDQDLAKIRDKYKDADVIHNGDEQSPVGRIPLPSPALMRVTSGGIPLGRMTRLWGSPSSGKSLISWMIIKAAQELKSKQFPKGLETCYHNIEKQYDPVFTAARGVDTKRMKVSEGDIIEEVASKLQLLLGSVHVHVLDSCSQATSQDTLAKDPADWDVALEVRVWKKSLHYIHNAMDKDENAIVYVDHVSVDFKTQRERALGGKEMEHASSMSLHFRRGEHLYYDDEGLLTTYDKMKAKGIMGIAGEREADGAVIKVIVEKSRVCRPFRVAVMRLDLNTFQFDQTYELMTGAQYFDVQGGIAHHTGLPSIAQGGGQGGWYTLPSGEKVQGEKALRLKLEQDETLRNLTWRAMLAGH